MGLTFTNERESLIAALKKDQYFVRNETNSNCEKTDELDEEDENDIIRSFRFIWHNKPSVDGVLSPFFFSNEKYFEPCDCTDEIKEAYASLSGDEKEEYPTIQSLAEEGYGYVVETDENGDEKYVDYYNPNGRFDYWLIGGRWRGYLLGKDGHKYDALPFDDVDWDNQLAKDIIPFWMLTIDGNWVERPDESGEDMRNKIHEYIDELKALSELERKNIVVYTIDIHD